MIHSCKINARDVLLSVDLVTYMSIRNVLVQKCWSDATANKNWKLKCLPICFPRQKLEIFEILEFALVRPGAGFTHHHDNNKLKNKKQK